MCDKGLCRAVPIPATHIRQLLRGSRRRSAKRSVIKDVEDTKSTNALACIVEPPGVMTHTYLAGHEEYLTFTLLIICDVRMLGQWL